MSSDAQSGTSPAPPPSDVTILLGDAAQGKSGASDRLASLVYDELHVIAVAAMRREADGHTWQPTDLVHDVFVKLVGHEQIAWQNRQHFYSVAARAMRRLLVDHARARRQLKRDGGAQVPLTANIGHVQAMQVDVLDLNDALDKLALLNQRQVQIVELRFFGGLTAEETAQALEISVATVKRDWTIARAYLRLALGAPTPEQIAAPPNARS